MAADPLDALRLPVVPIEPRPAFAAALLRRIETAEAGATGETAEAASPAAEAGATGGPGPVSARETPTVRYFVDDLDNALAFYRGRLGFTAELVAAPGFAMLYRGDLRLLLSVPGVPGAGAPLPDGTLPAAGGWNRISLLVPDIDAAVGALREAGVSVRAGVTAGVAVRQALIQDPSGNLVELVEPAAGYHERTEK
jgi:catechol 2,3-dioxygenase-like lactoylglutathione lyase family enzyme